MPASQYIFFLVGRSSSANEWWYIIVAGDWLKT